MDTGICYIIDENGYIMFISQHEGIDRLVRRIRFEIFSRFLWVFFQEDIGKFIGEFEGPLMHDLVAKKVFSEFVSQEKNVSFKLKKFVFFSE